MCTHPLVTVVQLQIKEGQNVFVEDVQIYGNGTFTCTKLVYADRCIVQLANPRDYTGTCVFVSTDI
ncbi:hypothetical protein D3C74_455500 [compost metagenome]